MNIKSKVTPVYFVSSTLILHGITLLAGIITYRYVPPEYMGIWATFTTFTMYSTFLRLGIPNGMNRELPFFLGRGDTKTAYSYAETTLFYSLFISVVLLIVGAFFYGGFNYSKYGENEIYYQYCMIAVFFKIVSEPYSTYLSSTFRTNDSFNKLSNIQMIMSILRLVSVLLVVFWSFVGYILRDALLTLINLLLLHFLRPLPMIKPKFCFSIWKKLLAVGIPIFFSSYFVSLIDTLPRLFIIKEGTSIDMGIFAPVMMLFSVIALVPNTLTSYLYPKFSQAFGRGEDFDYFWKKMKLIYVLSIVVSLVAGLIVFFLIDYVIQLFPKYIDSVYYIKISCFVLLFIGYKLGSALFVVFKKWNYLCIYTISYGVISAISLFLCTHIMKDLLTGIVVSLFITYFAMYILSILLTYKLNKQFC